MPPRPARRQREHDQRRAVILEAAESVFAEKGYSGASMEEVARRAEFAVGTLYNFFRNKQALYSAILHSNIDQFEARVRPVLEASLPPLEQLTRYVQVRIDLFWEFPRYFRLFFHHTTNTFNDPHMSLPSDLAERYGLLLKRIEALFADAVRTGDCAPYNPQLMAYSLEAVIRNMLIRLSREPNPVRNRQDEADLLALFCTGCLSERGRARLDAARSAAAR